MSGIHAGQLVAVYLQDSSDEPAIGRVLEVEAPKIYIAPNYGTPKSVHEREGNLNDHFVCYVASILNILTSLESLKIALSNDSRMT